MAARTKAPPRRRRTADEARKGILEAAERRLVERGPAGIRLQDVAADVGVSHPTVLHHFGSREGLVKAVLERVHDRIYAPILESLREPRLDEGAMTRLLDRVFATLESGGHARVLYWLALEGDALHEEHALRLVVEAVHGIRKARAKRKAPSLEETRFAVVLATLAMTSSAVVGRHVLENAGGAADAAAEKRFRAWLARLLVLALDA